MLDKRRTNYFFSSDLSKERLRSFYKQEDCFPLDVVIHPTTKCNHSCDFCYHKLNFQGKNHHNFDLSRFLLLSEELKNIGTNALVISGGGEPLKHREIGNMVEEASKFPFSSIYTNLDIPLNEELIMSLSMLDVINVNINTSNEDTYKNIRGRNANLMRVRNNLKHLLEKQDNVNGIITVRQESLPTLEKTIKDFYSWGISQIIISPAFDLEYTDQYDPKQCVKDLERIKSKITENTIRILEPEEKTATNTKGNQICHSHYFDITVGANEEVYPCCNVAYLEQYKIVDLKNYPSFKDAWSSKERKLWIGSKKIGCKTCWLSPVNKQIAEKIK